MTWLARLDPHPPPALLERIAMQFPGSTAEPSPEGYLAAAERLLDGLLADGCASRDGALDLLVADALVTYAFEAASVEPARIVERAQAAMNRIAGLAVR